MSRREIERIVDECVDDIAAGRRTVAECADAHPKYRAELLPLLEAAVAIQELSTVPERPVDPVLRAELMAELRRTPQQRRRARLSWVPRPWPAGAGFGRLLATATSAAAIAVLALVVVVMQDPPPATASTTLTVFAGSIEERRDDRWVPVEDGSLLAEGARLRTREDGRALLTFADGSTATLGPGTELVLERVEVGATREVMIDQRSGRIWSDVVAFEPGGSSYAIRTPDAVVEAVGTVFETAVEGGGTAVVAAEGTVAVQTAAEQVEVHGGEFVRLHEQQVAERLESTPTARVEVLAPFAASLIAADGAATGARPDGVMFRQVPGVITTDPGEGPQTVDMSRAAAGPYTLLLRRFADGDGSVVIESAGEREVVEIDRPAETVRIRIEVEVKDETRTISVLGPQMEDGPPGLVERIVSTPRSDRARPVAERRLGQVRGQGQGAGNGDGPSTPAARPEQQAGASERLLDRLRQTFGSAEAGTATPSSSPDGTATGTGGETATTAPVSPTANALERIEGLVRALEDGDTAQAAVELEAIAEHPDAEVIREFRQLLAGGLDRDLLERLRFAFRRMEGGDREGLLELLADGWNVDPGDLDLLDPGGDDTEPSPSPTSWTSPSPSATPSQTSSPTASPTASPTPSPTPTGTPGD